MLPACTERVLQCYLPCYQPAVLPTVLPTCYLPCYQPTVLPTCSAARAWLAGTRALSALPVLLQTTLPWTTAAPAQPPNHCKGAHNLTANLTPAIQNCLARYCHVNHLPRWPNILAQTRQFRLEFHQIDQQGCPTKRVTSDHEWCALTSLSHIQQALEH